MKIEIAKLIVEAAASNGIDLELHEDYSGRGMFGQTTAGIIFGNISDWTIAVSILVREVVNDSHEGISMDDVFEGLSGLRTDSMARDTIVY